MTLDDVPADVQMGNSWYFPNTTIAIVYQSLATAKRDYEEAKAKWREKNAEKGDANGAS